MAKQKATDLEAAMFTAAEAAKEMRPGFQPWFKRLPPEALAELEAMRDRWRAGGYGELPQRHAAEVVLKWGTERGYKMPSATWAVVRWLTGRI